MSDQNVVYCCRSGQAPRPVTVEALQAMIASGQLTQADWVHVSPTQGWMTVAQYSGSGATTSPRVRTSCGLATASLVSGILGLVLWFPSIAAIVMGHSAIMRIRRSAGSLCGEGLAIAGMILGYVVFALGIVIMGIVFASVAVPAFMRFQPRSWATTVLNECRMLDAALDQYALENSKQQSSAVVFVDLTPYLKAGSKLANNGGNDSLGNGFTIGPSISNGIRVSQYTKIRLLRTTGGDAFWGPYS